MLCRKCKKEIPDESIYCMYCGAKQTMANHGVKSRGNGTGTVYKLPNGKYMAEITTTYVTDGGGKLHRKKRTKTCDKKKDAWTALSKLKENAPEPQKSPTLYELHEIFIKSNNYDKLSKSQKDKLSYAWNRLKPLYYEKISEITVDDMQSTIDNVVKTYYPARDMKVMLSHLYTIAIKRDKAQYNKSEYIELPESPKAKREVFTDDEIQAFWDDYNGIGKDKQPHEELKHPFTGFILIMSYAGLRSGEMANIEKENVFLKDRYMIGGEKTEAGIDRQIAISKKILPIVMEKYNSGKKKLLEMNEDNFYKNYWETIERTGARHLPPQTCRHTYFTRLAAAQVQPGIIAAAGGHADFNTTYRNYIRLALKDKLDAVDKI